MTQKLSPELMVHLRALARREAGRVPAAEVQRIELLLEFTGDIADLVAVGFSPRSVLENPDEGYTIATGTLPVDRLADLAAIDQVVEVEGSQKLIPHLNYSVPTMHADAVHAGTPPRTGRNVVIGIIDSGIDWRHGDFVDPNTGKSRILALWNQRLDPPDPGETAGPGGVGVVYNNDQISRALKGQGKVRGRMGAHGTHVAGIAAGNGAPACCCHRPYAYVGVAPDADLIIVRYEDNDDEDTAVGENQGIVNALRFIFEHPTVAGRPVVINLSQSENRGAHDGTSPVEQAIDDMVRLPRRAVVTSAGNRSDENCHVTASVPGHQDLAFEFTMPERKEKFAWLDLWYARAGTLHIEVTAPNGRTSGPVTHGTSDHFIVNPAAADADFRARVDVRGTINGDFSRDNNWRVRIRKRKGTLPHGSWTVKLTNPGAAPVRFHAWLERGEPRTEFLPAAKAPQDPAATPPDNKLRASPDSTLGVPSTAAHSITVGYHKNKPRCCKCDVETGIGDDSGRGPIVRGAAANRKPNIAAPGLAITSAMADARNMPGHCCSCCPDACCELYVDKFGTSMAAPHVAGTIALMFEENPNLTSADVLRFLEASATPRQPDEPEELWGAGRLNAQAAIAAVRAAGGGAGGGGGGGHPPHVPLDPVGLASAPVRMSQALQLIRARLAALPQGAALAAAVSRHFSEVRRLINSNRRVATMWHRAAGPYLLRRLFQGAIDAGAPAPLAGPVDRKYLDRWWDLLARYGSPRLRAGLERYRSVVMALLGAPLAGRLGAQMAAHTDAVPAIEPPLFTEATVGA